MPFKKNDNRISQKGYDAELLAEEILESQGYEILYNPERMKRKYEKDRKSMDPVIKKQWGEAREILLSARENRFSSKLTQKELEKSRNAYEKARKEFDRIDKIHHRELVRTSKELDNIEKKRDLAESIIGESLMPEINRKEWEKVLGAKIEKSLFRLTYVDLFCKKNRDYYIFEVKHKTFKEKSNLNSFSVTNYEVLNFNRISNEGKVKLKVLIILEKEKKSFYKIFDWSDFAYSQNYDPHKTSTTNIRLREGFDISKLVKI